MSKSNRNSGKHWSNAEENNLRKLANQNTPTRGIDFSGKTTQARMLHQPYKAGK